MSQTFHYAEPRVVDDPRDCYFYHSMNIPGHGEVQGDWDLRDAMPAYLGNFDFRGKRVLDIGAASGFLSFTMEKHGAEVVSFDMADGAQWDLVPHHTVAHQLDSLRLATRETHRRLTNAYWFAHRRLSSKAKVHYGNVYDLPLELGEFDVIVLGMILGHLRDPFQALYGASRLCAGSIIVVNQATPLQRAVGRFMPSTKNQELMAWWRLTPECLQQMLGILGFEIKQMCDSWPQCTVPGRVRKEKCFAAVAPRVAGSTSLELARKACA
ncbi:MAG: methyltransferase domain-containing protein [Gemmataceae bacterium]|nr:methyltransferase domain-containing protein [Gemmataceae bacterium]